MAPQNQHRAPNQASNQTMELAPIETSNSIMPLVPTTIEGAIELAKYLSKSMFLPDKLKGKEADIGFVIMRGLELGLAPMASLSGLYIVNGRVALESKTKAALALSRGAAEYVRRVCYTPQKVTWETKRKGAVEPVQMSFTIEEAWAAGLAPDAQGRGGKEGPWRTYTQRMMSWRALGWLMDDVYPDIMMGVATAEDFAGEDDGGGFQPIGGGVEISRTPPAAPPPAESFSGAPTTARPVESVVVPPGPEAKPASASPMAAKPAPAGSGRPPIESEEEIKAIIAKFQAATHEKELKRISAEEEIAERAKGAVRERLREARDAQLELIQIAARDAE